MYREEIVLLEKENLPAPVAEPEQKTAQEAPEAEPKRAKVAEDKPRPENARESKEKAKSLVVEKPNYDFIEQLTPEEEQKVYKIEKDKPQEKSNSFGKKLKLALFALVVSVCGVWGIVNIVEITNLESQIAASTTEYNLSVEKYVWYLSQLDEASSKNDLFETYPTEIQPPSSIGKQSNWFDRVCNFIARLFGG